MEKLEQIKTILSLGDEGILDAEEILEKIKLVVGKNITATPSYTRKGFTEDEIQSISKRAKKLGFTKARAKNNNSSKRNYKKFTEREDNFIRRNSGKLSTTQIAKTLGRRTNSILARKQILV